MKKKETIEYDLNSLHALINNTNDLMWSVDRNYKLITSNKAFDEIMVHMAGRPILNGHNILDVSSSKEEAARYKTYYDRAFLGEAFKIAEHTNIPVAFWSELSFYPIINENEIVGTACYSHDVTARKAADEQLRKSEANLKAIFENASESFFLTDKTGTIIAFNSNAQKTMLLTSTTLMETGKNILEYVTDDRKDIFSAMLSKVAAGESIKYEQTFSDLAGGFHSYNFCINPVKEAGSVTGFCFNGRDTTLQKIAQEKIEQNEKRLEAERGKFTELFLQAPSCICILRGPGHIFEMANPTYLQLTGKKDIIGKGLVELFPEVASQGFIAMMDNIYNTGEPFIANEILIQIFRDSNDVLTDHYLNFVCQPFRNSEGEVEGIFFFANIVTEQVVARKKIEQNEARLEAERKRFADLFLQAPSCICILKGPDHVFEMANPLYLQFTGKKNVAGKTAREVFPEVAEQGFVGLLDSVFNTGVPVSGNEVFIQVDVEGNGGLTDYYMNFVYEPFRNSAGEIEGIFFFANIVTEEVLARQAIERNEKRYHALVENGGDVVVILSETGLPLYVSHSIERVLGYSEEEAMQLDLFSAIHPDDKIEVQKIMAQVLASPGIPIKGYMGRMRHKSGEWRWYEATITNMLHDPAIGGIVDNFRDVTDRVLANEKIIKTNRLYSFISQINQTIVQSPDEESLFETVCHIAINTGKFALAWISIPDEINKKLNVEAHCNATPGDLELLGDLIYNDDGPIANVLRSGTYFVINDLEDESTDALFKKYAILRGFKSCIVLPIKRSGVTIGAYNLVSTHANFFDQEEITLLEEAAGDISFALSVFEKEKYKRLMEDKVAHSESQLNQAQAIAHFGSWELIFSSGMATWSAEACRIYGFDTKDNVHPFETWVSLIHPDDTGHVMQEIEKQRKTLTPAAFHHRIIRKDQEIRHIYTQSEFELDKEGTPVGIYGVTHDITEVKRAEEGLSQSEANLRLIMDLIPQSIFAKDYSGKFVFVNKTFASLYGLSPENMMNKYPGDIIPSKDETAYFLKQEREVILSGTTKIIPEQPFTDYKGNVRLFHTTKVPFTVAGSSEKAVLGIAMDITDEKQAETERTKMVSDIVQRNKDLEQFSYIVSHNLRAPVANISGIAEILQFPDLDNHDKKMMIEELGLSVQKMDDVIMDLNDILQVKHAENKKIELVKFSKLIADIKLSIDNLIRIDDVQIISDFSAIDEMHSIRSYLYSIFFNLISNSIKYRQPLLPPVIEIRSARVAGKVQIIYRDNGIGIDMKNKGEQIFGLYKRFHSHVEGKGMGLFMVKTQVESLGGNIAVTSELNKGIEFCIEFKAD